MKYSTIIWDLDDDPDSNVQHILAHELSKEEVEGVLQNPAGTDADPRDVQLPLARHAPAV